MSSQVAQPIAKSKEKYVSFYKTTKRSAVGLANGPFLNVFPGSDSYVRVLEVIVPNGKKYKRSLSGVCILSIN